ncbi:MAG: DUF3021 family protein [Lachnospiraceae bacterium]|nr:DUF3021 family protein [Lachnospiraceae bacterium]
MNNILEKIRAIFQMYLQIVALVILASAIYITVFWGYDCEVDGDILWQIMGVSALCSLCTPILMSKRELSKRAMLFREILHFVMINVIVLFSGFCFEWFYVSDWKMIVGMELTIVGVYIGVCTIYYVMNRKTAEEMNRKLKERQEENAES